MSLLSRNFLITIILVMILSMLFIGLYPFNYFPTNSASINDIGKSLNFSGRGIAYARSNRGWSSKDPITLEIAFTPARTHTRGIPHILSLCDQSGREVMYLGQWSNSLILRLMEGNRRIEKVKNEIGIGDVLKPGEQVFITLAFNSGTVNIYSNGKLALKQLNFDFAGATKEHPIRSLVLGNSSAGDSSWRGEFSAFTVWNATTNSSAIRDRFEKWTISKVSDIDGALISYNFEDGGSKTISNETGGSWELLIPENLTPLKRKFLELPSKRYLFKRSFYEDAAINLIGFMPLGLALSIFFVGDQRKRITWEKNFLPVIAGGLLSLFIEVNQAFLVTRTSSVTDFILNSVGAGIAVGAYLMWNRIGLTMLVIRGG